MRQILYTCPFIPAEWIAAHGFTPMRIIPLSARTRAALPLVEGLCSFAQAFAGHVITDKESSGAIFTTACDQMRRVHELVVNRRTAQTFLLNLPKTWQHIESSQLYMDELRRLSRWLCTLGGHAPDIARHAHLTDGLQQDLPVTPPEIARPGPPCQDSTIRLAIVGGPLLAGEFDLFDFVARNGGRIVLDATETGELTVPDRLDPLRMRCDPLRELARCYFESIPAVWKRPNTALFRWLIRKCAEHNVQGIICRRLVWCDLWHVEVHRLREALQLPLLDLDVSDDGFSAAERTAGRVQAFLETLQ